MGYFPEQFPRHLKYPQIPVQQFLIDSAERSPDKPAIICQDRTLSFRELVEKSRTFAKALLHQSILPGDRVMIALRNVPEFAIAFFGTLIAGGIVTTAHPLSSQEELSHLIKDSCTRFLIADSAVKTNVGLLPPDDQPQILIDGSHLSISESLNKSVLSNIEIPNATHSHENIAVLQYTGGTTGMPKGAVMLHRNLVANAIQNATWWSWADRDVIMGVLTLGHTWGLCCCLLSVMYAGAAVVLIPKFDPNEVLQEISIHQATILYGSATMFHRLCNELEHTKVDLSSLRLTKAGAMPVPDHLCDRWKRLTGIPLTLGYGLTEASPETHNPPLGRPKPDSIGIPIFDTDAKVIDPEDPAKELPVGEIGELCVQGPQVCSGYWNRPEETLHTFIDGWLRTGDLAYRDKEGYYYLVDRLKDLIKHRGYSVFPAELENILLTHPGVKECLVVGEPDPIAGEIPVAHVVPASNWILNSDELIDYCTSKISPLKTVRGIVFHDTLPHTAVGKGLRRFLRNKKGKKNDV